MHGGAGDAVAREDPLHEVEDPISWRETAPAVNAARYSAIRFSPLHGAQRCHAENPSHPFSAGATECPRSHGHRIDVGSR
jgi:hypothetical protein